MVTQLPLPTDGEIIYPESDGQPMADNTLQFRWITVIYHNLAWLLAQDPNVFIAGDLLWYPVQGNNKLRQAPDVMVAFGVPKGERGSYQQWQENNIAPQVVFEILSPGNTKKEMNRKLLFYDRYGVEEYYLFDPQNNNLTGWLRAEAWLDIIEPINGWVSPRLGIRFDLSSDHLVLYRPDGQPFADYLEVQQQLTIITEQLEQERQAKQTVTEQLAQERQAKQTVTEQLAQERQRNQRLEQLLREAGLNPDHDL
ncbi:Uma2 family endonuclease [Spirulina subsalsa FACHB-351]|uniref:Uma2 family endonuclease n=1 Tax=Spirulina subsalsa FACHB-351 TaxID=234711 RepID=A0ABT3L3Q0_9CYAN|nr:Uma2 family endonuclease [Spirulina subsalsa]MCW6036090.1 Uma2 family endonuclease [Spirulina subsalsa FACHB-351]